MATAASKKEKTKAAAPAVNQTLKRLNLDDPRQSLLCLPEKYSDTRTTAFVLPDEDEETPRLYNLRYTGVMEGYDRNKKPIDIDQTGNWRWIFQLKIELIDDEDNPVTWSVFGNVWPYRELVKDEYLNLVGRVQYFGPKPYLCDVSEPPAYAIGHIWTHYKGIPGRVSGEKIEAQVLAQVDNPDAYRHCVTKLIGTLGMTDKEALEAAGASELFDSFEAVIRALHRPVDIEQGMLAKMVANKLAAVAIQSSALRHNVRHAHPDAPLAVDEADIDVLAKTQKETLTASQLRVAKSITSMMRAPKPMNALLSGDVGTGKTIPFLLAAVTAHRAGAQVAIVAPTSILADQIAKQLIMRFGTQVKGIERIVAGGKIADHASILVGTPGLVSVATKAKYSPNFLICDEQHKLPTSIREKLIKPWTHTLDVSATPIPRSLASALFGGKEILNLRECPVEKTFNCLVGDLTMRPKFSAMLKHALDNGDRAAVIYPRVNANAEKPSESGDVQVEVATVLSGAKALELAFPGKVVAIHGGMKDEEIAAAIESVRDGSKPLVVASTVIETGVDIPGITAMVVRDADWFGISQLHQLRGRLVRHGGVGWFAMMVKDMNTLADDTYARLEALRTTTDGYALAEMDLIIRGFGDLAGENQSGVATETVFRLVKMGPEDFLRKKLSKESLKDHSVDLSAQRQREQASAQEAAQVRMQPRLFG